MRQLTDGERDVLSELERDAREFARMGDISQEEWESILSELEADMPPELPVSEAEIDEMFREWEASRDPNPNSLPW